MMLHKNQEITFFSMINYKNMQKKNRAIFHQNFTINEKIFATRANILIERKD